MTKVAKRDGRIVKFESQKIFNAILKAYNEIYPKSEKENEVEAECHLKAVLFDIGLAECKDHNTHIISVEEIQDKVEDQLMVSNRDVARAYIRYRYKRELARNDYADLMEGIKEKLSGENVQNQNANVDEHSFGGRIGEATDLMMKKYALEYCMSDMAKNNHLNNEIYIHDLSHYPVGDHNCITLPLDDLLANGFNTRQTDVRPAQSINTAFQLVAVLFQIQSLQQFGR